jgi:putative transposase
MLRRAGGRREGAPTCAASTGCRKATFYNWKAKFGGMDVSEAKRLKALEDENARLKKLLAEQMLDAAAMRSWCQKNGRARRQARSRRASAGRRWACRSGGPAPSSPRIAP